MEAESSDAAVETPILDAPATKQKKAEKVAGEFLIVLADKRTVKSTCSGQVIEVMKRAKSPLTVKQIAARVKTTKVGKSLTVKDITARSGKVVRWYRDNSDFVVESDDGFSLARKEA